MTTSKTESNGSKTAAPQARERITGWTRVVEAQAYHGVSIAHDAAFEAERLCNEIHRAASDAYLRDSRAGLSEAAAVLDDPATQDKITEVVCCMAVAIEALCALVNQPPQ